MTSTQYCPVCDWDANEERIAYEIEASKRHRSENTYIQDSIEKDRVWYAKWRGDIPAEKFECRRQGHTHFSMRITGVFPKGTETYESISEKVKGTFGGRFLTEMNKESFRFEYIAYTD